MIGGNKNTEEEWEFHFQKGAASPVRNGRAFPRFESDGMVTLRQGNLGRLLVPIVLKDNWNIHQWSIPTEPENA